MFLIRAVKLTPEFHIFLLKKKRNKTPLFSPLWDGQWHLIFYCPRGGAKRTSTGRRSDQYWSHIVTSTDPKRD